MDNDTPLPERELPPVTAVPASGLDLTPDERNWGMLCHLSSLIALAAGGMMFLGPLIVWLIKKDSSAWVNEQGKSALNFQLNVLIYMAVAVAAAVASCGVLIPLPALVLVYGIILPIIASVKVNNGERYEYPYVIALLK